VSTFQLITLPALAVAALITIAAMRSRRLTGRAGAAWLFLWAGAAASVAFPESLAVIARSLGIGRGADLVLYLSILFMFAAFFIVYLRFRKIDEQLTRIVRHLAIRDARGDDGNE
jgi:hypothetical protein